MKMKLLGERLEKRLLRVALNILFIDIGLDLWIGSKKNYGKEQGGI